MLGHARSRNKEFWDILPILNIKLYILLFVLLQRHTFGRINEGYMPANLITSAAAVTHAAHFNEFVANSKSCDLFSELLSRYYPSDVMLIS